MCYQVCVLITCFQFQLSENERAGKKERKIVLERTAWTSDNDSDMLLYFVFLRNYDEKRQSIEKKKIEKHIAAACVVL